MEAYSEKDLAYEVVEGIDPTGPVTSVDPGWATGRYLEEHIGPIPRKYVIGAETRIAPIIEEPC